MTRVLALPKYGSDAASTRQRLLQFIPALNAAGIEVDLRPLLENDYVKSLASGQSFSRAKVLRAYARRLNDLRRGRRYDGIWAYAELFPYLPGAFERLALHSGTPIIYDCDDAFFHAHEQHWLLRDKLRPLIRGAAAVSAGNAYLAAYCRRWNHNVEVIPTVVDTDAYRPAERRSPGIPVIGWIGSPSTWQYVRPVLPLLSRLCSDGRAHFLAVGAGRAAEPDRFGGMELRDWRADREISDVQSMDIGIMPLPDQPWTRGKCGYKLIQYMACGIPAVATPVGVNSDIVVDGENGYLANSEQEWEKAFEGLLGSTQLRRKLGSSGRRRIVEHYSLVSQAPRVVELFRRAIGARGS